MAAGLFGSSPTVNKPQQPATKLRVQSSTQGKPRPIGWGMNRLAGNLIWYGDFKSIAVQSSTDAGGGGGKGTGLFGGSTGGQTQQTSYNYTVAVAIALCEGPIAGIGTIWNNKSKQTYSTTPPTGLSALMGFAARGGAKSNYGFTLFDGSYTQSAWGYLVSLHPTEALDYRGDAYMAAGPLQLGDQPELPNLSFEVKFAINTAYTGTTDANPQDIIYDLLTNPHYSVGFPALRVAANPTYAAYCVAAPLVMSPVIVDQRAAVDHLRDWMTATNSDFVWSGGVLKIVPYGDTQINAGTPTAVIETHTIPGAIAPAGPQVTVNFAAQIISLASIRFSGGGAYLTKVNPGDPLYFRIGSGFGYPLTTSGTYYEIAPGTYVFATADIGASIDISYTYATVASYTPPSNPLYELFDNDFIPGSGNTGAPVEINRSRVEDQNNSVQVEFLDASNDYNPAIAEAKDDAGIQQYGLRKKGVVQQHGITQVSVATMSASLMLGREQVRNQYTFTVQSCFILLDPMDIISIDDPDIGANQQWVRIKEITENDDGTLSIVAEEYLNGTGGSPLYGSQPLGGHIPNYNAAPSPVGNLILFEPTDELAHGLFVWGAVTGADLSTWGGCEVWVSWDNLTYQKLPNAIVGPSRIGSLTATLPSFARTPQGATIDGTSTLSVDFTVSHSSLTSGSLGDNLLSGSLLWVGFEFMSYQNVAVTGTYSFDVTTLNRGLYGSGITEHGVGTDVVRVDQGLFSVPFTPDKIGATLYFKFLSFNQFGGGKLGLEDTGAIAHKIVGTALISPLPDVQNFVNNFVGDITYFDWDIVDDFRSPIEYEIRKGINWDSANFVGTYAHPHVPAIGDATYWIKAVCTPIAGLTVYSENATLLGVDGSVIPGNLLASYDEGPSGTKWPGTLSGNVFNDGIFIETVTADATAPDFLLVPDILVITDIFLIGFVGSGYYTIPDTHIINLGRLAPCLIEISFSIAGSSSTDFFNPGPPDNNDVFAHSDIFDTAASAFINGHGEIAISTDGVTFGPWQKYAAGFYNMWKVKARMFIESTNSTNVATVLTDFVFTVYAPDRIDHPLVNASIAAGGQTVTFHPDNTSTNAAFNGGPNGGTTTPSLGITLPAASVPGTQATIVNLTAGDDVFLTGLSLSQVTIQVKNAGVGVSRNVTLQVWGF